MNDFRTLRRLGPSPIMITPIGLGCWQFSKGKGLAGRYWATLDDDEIERIIAASLDGGINWFDTAESYGGGESEKALSRGLQRLAKKPGEIVIATKWRPVFRRASNMLRTIGARQANLAPFPIDLYQVHNPLSFSTIRAEMAAMASLVESEKIRSVGVSNYSRKQMERAHRELAKLGLPLVSNQVRFSLLDRSIERTGVLDAARDLGITIIAYSPLAQGLLTGTFHDDPGLVRRKPGFRKFMPTFRKSGLEKSRPVIEALRRIAPKYQGTPAQAALNWLIGRCGDTVVAIPGAGRAAQVADFTAAMGFRLSDEDAAELDRASTPFK